MAPGRVRESGHKRPLYQYRMVRRQGMCAVRFCSFPCNTVLYVSGFMGRWERRKGAKQVTMMGDSARIYMYY